MLLFQNVDLGTEVAVYSIRDKWRNPFKGRLSFVSDARVRPRPVHIKKEGPEPARGRAKISKQKPAQKMPENDRKKMYAKMLK